MSAGETFVTVSGLTGLQSLQSLGVVHAHLSRRHICHYKQRRQERLWSVMHASHQPHVSPSITVIHGNSNGSRTSDCEARSLRSCASSRGCGLQVGETRHFRLMKTKIESVIKATAALSARKLNVCSLGLEPASNICEHACRRCVAKHL